MRRWVSECRARPRRRRAAATRRSEEEKNSRGRGGSGRRKKEESAAGGRGVRTSGPTPVSESDIQAVAQRCGDSPVFSVHVEVRKGKERVRCE